MKIAAGLAEPGRGTRFVHPGITLRYLPQEPDFGAHGTVRAYVDTRMAMDTITACMVSCTI